VALNNRGDDSSDGELGDDTLDVIAAWERKKIGERMNRGKVRKARQGKIFVGPSPSYGYRFDEGRDAYLVDEEKMAVVRRIFRMVGSRGMTLNSVGRAPKDEGILSPSGQRLWNKLSIRRFITDDVYLSRTFEEVAALVTPDVAEKLEKDTLYGVWWYGRARHVRSRQRVIGPDGKLRYRKVGKRASRARGGPRRGPRARRGDTEGLGAERPEDHSRERMGVQRRAPGLATHRRGTPLLRVRQGDENQPYPFALRRLLPLRGTLSRRARAVSG